MSDKKQQTLGWNANYFGEPKEGSLAKTIADITSKQNNLVGGKPEVADSQVVQAEKAKAELNQESLSMKATFRNGDDKTFKGKTASDIKKQVKAYEKKHKTGLQHDGPMVKESISEMQANTPTSNAGVQTIKKTQAKKPMGAVDSSQRKINANLMRKGMADMQAQKKNKKEDEDMAQKQSKSKDKGPVKVHGEDVNKEIEAAQQGKVNSLVQSIIDVMYSKNEALAKDDEGEVKKTADMLKKASKAHAAQAKDLEKQIDDEGNAFGKALMAAKNKGEKTFTVAGKQYNVEAEMDKVNPVAVKKKFADRKDKDIDNDGDVDSSDKFLHKRRKAISKSMKENLGKEDEPKVKEVIGMLKKASKAHADQSKSLDKAVKEAAVNVDDKGEIINKKKHDAYGDPKKGEVKPVDPEPKIGQVIKGEKETTRANGHMTKKKFSEMRVKLGQKGKTDTGKDAAVVETEPKVNPI